MEENKLPEMELENLEKFLELLKLRTDDQLMLVGQINYITEENVAVEITVSTFADYNGTPIIMSWKNELGKEKLPTDEKDTEQVEKMKQFETIINNEKNQIKQQIEKEGFDVAFGVWK